MNSRRVIALASLGRFRQTRTMEEARALTLFFRFPESSVLTGHVPSTT